MVAWTFITQQGDTIISRYKNQITKTKWSRKRKTMIMLHIIIIPMKKEKDKNNIKGNKSSPYFDLVDNRDNICNKKNDKSVDQLRMFILLTPHINAHQSAKPRHVCTIFLQSWISYLVIEHINSKHIHVKQFYPQDFLSILHVYKYLKWNENILKVKNKWINKARKYILNFKKETVFS